MAAKRSAAAQVDTHETSCASLPRRARSAKAACGARSQLDRLMHDRTRLAIVTALSVNPSLSFTELVRSRRRRMET